MADSITEGKLNTLQGQIDELRASLEEFELAAGAFGQENVGVLAEQPDPLVPSEINDQVGVDLAAVPNFLGAAFNDGVLQTDGTMTYIDGGNFVTRRCAGKGGSEFVTIERIFCGDAEPANAP